VIDIKLDRKDHSSIPVTAIGKELKPLDVRTDPKSNSTIGRSEKK
jgi:hypothetical protein